MLNPADYTADELQYELSLPMYLLGALSIQQRLCWTLHYGPIVCGHTRDKTSYINREGRIAIRDEKKFKMEGTGFLTLINPSYIFVCTWAFDVFCLYDSQHCHRTNGNLDYYPPPPFFFSFAAFSFHTTLSNT